MPALAIAALVIQYGPELISIGRAVFDAVEPLFVDGGAPSQEEINAAIAHLVTEHARLQATS